VLVNNAGAVFARRELTAEGIEKTFAVNHLAPFLLTNLLLDRVRAAPAGRIVMVTSGTYSSALDFDNLQSEKGHQFLGAYFRSKLENILFTFELSRRLAGTPVTANCLFPGPTRTRFGNNLDGLAALFGLFMQNFPFLASPEKGARTAIYLGFMFDVAKCEPSRSPMMWVSRAGCGASAKLSASQARQKRDRGGWSGNAELRRFTENRNKKAPARTGAP
jgi:NAD(P)-dependent dehydrogenase (short-subunit alcohol dehydrogenase family)